MLKTGDRAPYFCLADGNGRETCLEGFKGKWVVLYFYPKDNTPGCTTEAIDFTKRLPDYNKLDAVILGVSPDSSQSHCNFSDKRGLKITLLSDAGKKALKSYGSWQLKSMYGKEYWGVMRSTFLIDPKGRIAHIWPKVDVKGHALEVKQKLKELQK